VGAVADDELVELYARCRGFVTTARDEDFGMTAVEAMAAGKPVVAPAEGGYLESVVDNDTGALVPDVDAEKIARAVAEVSARLAADPLAYRDAAQARAGQFGANRFADAVRAELESLADARQ
jgi:glycosyltransferase involved in cell wall biosynthesis